MESYRHIFGPVPSRRLGRSLGISPLPDKTCNYSCVYCQLGRTVHMTNTRSLFYPVEEITEEFDRWLRQEEGAADRFDVVTVVGEGEPTLYAGLGDLLAALQERTDKPLAVITNSALLTDPAVAEELLLADIVLPSLDGFDEDSFRRVDRPYGRLDFQEITAALGRFSRLYTGQLWLEIMLVESLNDREEAIPLYQGLLKDIRHDRLYINTPVRPPAEPSVRPVSPDRLARFAQELGGVSIDALTTGAFHSEVTDDYEAVLGIIRRHPMNQYEIAGFLEARQADPVPLLTRLEEDPGVETVRYKGYVTYRHRPQ
ncbi:MAG: radical SAM protein [Clostridiales bacterium]|nr:radical SAM protein [Clostridiales bacterium]